MAEKNVFVCKPDVVGERIEIRMYGSKVSLRICEVDVKGIPGEIYVSYYFNYRFSLINRWLSIHNVTIYIVIIEPRNIKMCCIILVCTH